jgi:hypothetical protein
MRQYVSVSNQHGEGRAENLPKPFSRSGWTGHGSLLFLGSADDRAADGFITGAPAEVGPDQSLHGVGIVADGGIGLECAGGDHEEPRGAEAALQGAFGGKGPLQWAGLTVGPVEPFHGSYHGETGKWLSFPNPLLTPPSQFIAPYDWLPAVLEGILLAIAQSHEPPVMSSLRPYRVLRGLYDANSQDPASGIVPLSVVGLLREFILTGSSAPGLGSRIDSVAAARTPADRAAAAEDWLSTVRDTSAEYLAPGGAGAADGGAFATIATRLKASKTPIFRDLAPDVFWATEALTGLIRDVKGILESRTEGGATVFGTAEQVVIPEGGTF